MLRRILPFLLLCAPCCFASISIQQNGSATATSATLSSTNFGDLIIMCGNRANNTAPSLPTGYTNIQSGGANTQSGRCAWKISPGAETATGTMTNAANVAFVVLRGYDIQSSGPIGCAPSVSNASSTSLTYPTCSLVRSGGSSYLFAFGTATGASTTPPDTAPSGMTLLSSTSQSTLALSYLAGATSGTVSSVTIAPSTGHTGITFEVLANQSVSSIANYLVHSVAIGNSGEACSSSCSITVPVPSSSSNNFLNVELMWSYSGTAPSVSSIYCNSDTGHSTWTWTDFGHDVSDGSQLAGAVDYYIAGATSGCTSVTIALSQPTLTLTGHYTEWRQIATSSPVDAAAGQVSSAMPFVTPGTLNTATNGDVIYSACAADANGIGTYTTTLQALADGNTILEFDPSYSISTQAFVQTTASSTTGVYFDFSGYAGTVGDSAACIGLALKASAGAGTNPGGIQIVQQMYVNSSTATAHFQANVLNAGDTLMFNGLASQSAAQWSSVADSLGNTFTSHSTADYPAWALDCNALSGGDYFTISGAPSGQQGGWVIQEISGLNNSSHTACFDATAGMATAVGVASPYSTAPSITPSTANGLIEAYINFGTGPATAISSPSGGIYGYPTYTGLTDASHITEGGGFAYYANASTSAKSFTWTNANSSAWNASAIHLLPAPAGSRHRAIVIQQ